MTPWPTKSLQPLIFAFLLCLGVASCSSHSDYDEGQSTLSPNKKWFVDLDTSTNRLTQIRIYDTDVYPILKTNPAPEGTPTALFIVPIGFSARFVDLKWNP